MRPLTPAPALTPLCPHLTSPHQRASPDQVEQRRLQAQRAEEDARQAAAEAVQQEQYRKQQERTVCHIAARTTLALAPYMHRHRHRHRHRSSTCMSHLPPRRAPRSPRPPPSRLAPHQEYMQRKAEARNRRNTSLTVIKTTNEGSVHSFTASHLEP